MKKKIKSAQSEKNGFNLKKITAYFSIVAIAGAIVAVASFLSDWLIYNIPIIGAWIVPVVSGVVIFVAGSLYWDKSKQVEKSYAVEKKAYNELIRLTEVKDEFVLSTQHHLRTPLSIVNGYLAMMEKLLDKKNIDKTELREYLHKTAVSINRLIGLVNELLNISQMDLGGDATEFKSVNSRDLIIEIIKDLNIEIKKKNLHIEVIPRTGWPKLMIDTKKIKLVFFNLIDNAVKYSTEGNILIIGKKKGSFFQISVRDDGIGINPTEIKTIFDKYFERGRRAKKINTTGRGIGLHVAANIIRDHGGEIYAKSEGENKGSEFIVELPLAS